MSSQAEVLDCELLLKSREQNFLGDRPIALLEQIDAGGSIPRAAGSVRHQRLIPDDMEFTT